MHENHWMSVKLQLVLLLMFIKMNLVHDVLWSCMKLLRCVTLFQTETNLAHNYILNWSTHSPRTQMQKATNWNKSKFTQKVLVIINYYYFGDKRLMFSSCSLQSQRTGWFTPNSPFIETVAETNTKPIVQKHKHKHECIKKMNMHLMNRI